MEKNKINREQRKSLTGSPGQPWQLTGPELVVQAKFGQYLQDAKYPRLLSQTEEAVEWEQVSSKEQVLPMPDLNFKIKKKYSQLRIYFQLLTLLAFLFSAERDL